MLHHLWWNMPWSYVADWVLLALIYLFHKHIIKGNSLKPDEQTLKSALDNLHDIVFLLDNDCRITQIHGEWIKKHQLTPEYFIGKTVLEIVGEQQKEISTRVMEKIFHGEDEVYIWRYLLPNQKIYCAFQTSLSPIKDSKNQIIGAIGISLEIHCGVTEHNIPSRFVTI